MPEATSYQSPAAVSSELSVLVKMHAVEKTFDQHRELNQLNFELRENETTAIVGASGCGKSTLLQLVNGLLRPSRGAVKVFGEPLPYDNLTTVRRRIDYAVQQVGLYPHLSVFNNVTSQMWERLWRNTLRYLKLTAIALLLACAIGVPTAILAYRSERISGIVLYIAALLQTIPSIALLALMIPLFGIGQTPAIIALFLYSLLPILRNTITALTTIDPLLRRVAEGMGFTAAQQIRYLFVPLALPSILDSIRIAAVISIGTATLAAFIGAGGLGEPIVTGLSLNDSQLILQGALPAAVLAILTELLFKWLERMWVPAHMLNAQLSS